MVSLDKKTRRFERVTARRIKRYTRYLAPDKQLLKLTLSRVIWYLILGAVISTVFYFSLGALSSTSTEETSAIISVATMLAFLGCVVATAAKIVALLVNPRAVLQDTIRTRQLKASRELDQMLMATIVSTDSPSSVAEGKFRPNPVLLKTALETSTWVIVHDYDARLRSKLMNLLKACVMEADQAPNGWSTHLLPGETPISAYFYAAISKRWKHVTYEDIKPLHEKQVNPIYTPAYLRLDKTTRATFNEMPPEVLEKTLEVLRTAPSQSKKNS